MSKVPSPCIDVCKFKRQGHCIGCSMTKSQKSLFKKIRSDKHRRAFIDMLRGQQAAMGKYRHWEAAFRKKLRKKKIKLVWPKDLAA